MLTGNAGAEKNMYTENNEIIEDNMIVEFSYDFSREEQWRWVPLRVRYDKTAQLRGGEQNFGNAFHVANSNWHSIHNPITRMMMMSGENIPEELGDDDVYYNKVAGATKTRALRDFHNLYIKTSLIKTVAKPGNTLIDLAVGKGGDWPKWIDAKLKFIFGVDISRDNIQNRLDGACARYLTYRKKYRVMPSALFVNGNSSVNIKKTTGIMIDKDKQITRAVFGQGPKDEKVLGHGVYKHYGIAADGFDVCSIQFAIHYMFENQETLQNFLQNVSEVTKEGGYFIGTSYDGELLFNMLKKLPENESKVNMATNEQRKIWELIKRYDRAEFNDDDSCVGYAVDVFQESINKTVREYLVNYKYLTRILENYGFVLVNGDELKKLNSTLPSGTGLFSGLFNKMNDDIKANPQMRSSYGEAPFMTDGERTISFLIRYFIYKKVRKVSDAE
jgi:SAM-dependent methyltransferase